MSSIKQLVQEIDSALEECLFDLDLESSSLSWCSWPVTETITILLKFVPHRNFLYMKWTQDLRAPLSFLEQTVCSSFVKKMLGNPPSEMHPGLENIVLNNGGRMEIERQKFLFSSTVRVDLHVGEFRRYPRQLPPGSFAQIAAAIRNKEAGWCMEPRSPYLSFLLLLAVPTNDSTSRLFFLSRQPWPVAHILTPLHLRVSLAGTILTIMRLQRLLASAFATHNRQQGPDFDSNRRLTLLTATDSSKDSFNLFSVIDALGEMLAFQFPKGVSFAHKAAATQMAGAALMQGLTKELEVEDLLTLAQQSRVCVRRPEFFSLDTTKMEELTARLMNAFRSSPPALHLHRPLTSPTGLVPLNQPGHSPIPPSRMSPVPSIGQSPVPSNGLAPMNSLFPEPLRLGPSWPHGYTTNTAISDHVEASEHPPHGQGQEPVEGEKAVHNATPNAFIIFCSDYRTQLTEKLRATHNSHEVTQELARMWKQMDMTAKKPYYDRSMECKDKSKPRQLKPKQARRARRAKDGIGTPGYQVGSRSPIPNREMARMLELDQWDAPQGGNWRGSSGDEDTGRGGLNSINSSDGAGHEQGVHQQPSSSSVGSGLGTNWNAAFESSGSRMSQEPSTMEAFFGDLVSMASEENSGMGALAALKEDPGQVLANGVAPPHGGVIQASFPFGGTALAPGGIPSPSGRKVQRRHSGGGGVGGGGRGATIAFAGVRDPPFVASLLRSGSFGPETLQGRPSTWPQGQPSPSTSMRSMSFGHTPQTRSGLPNSDAASDSTSRSLPAASASTATTRNGFWGDLAVSALPTAAPIPYANTSSFSSSWGAAPTTTTTASTSTHSTNQSIDPIGSLVSSPEDPFWAAPGDQWSLESPGLSLANIGPNRAVPTATANPTPTPPEAFPSSLKAISSGVSQNVGAGSPSCLGRSLSPPNTTSPSSFWDSPTNPWRADSPRILLPTGQPSPPVVLQRQEEPQLQGLYQSQSQSLSLSQSQGLSQSQSQGLSRSQSQGLSLSQSQGLSQSQSQGLSQSQSQGLSLSQSQGMSQSQSQGLSLSQSQGLSLSQCQSQSRGLSLSQSQGLSWSQSQSQSQSQGLNLSQSQGLTREYQGLQRTGSNRGALPVMSPMVDGQGEGEGQGQSLTQGYQSLQRSGSSSRAPRDTCAMDQCEVEVVVGSASHGSFNLDDLGQSSSCPDPNPATRGPEPRPSLDSYDPGPGMPLFPSPPAFAPALSLFRDPAGDMVDSELSSDLGDLADASQASGSDWLSDASGSDLGDMGDMVSLGDIASLSDPGHDDHLNAQMRLQLPGAGGQPPFPYGPARKRRHFMSSLRGEGASAYTSCPELPSAGWANTTGPGIAGWANQDSVDVLSEDGRVSHPSGSGIGGADPSSHHGGPSGMYSTMPNLRDGSSSRGHGQVSHRGGVSGMYSTMPNLRDGSNLVKDLEPSQCSEPPELEEEPNHMLSISLDYNQGKSPEGQGQRTWDDQGQYTPTHVPISPGMVSRLAGSRTSSFTIGTGASQKARVGPMGRSMSLGASHWGGERATAIAMAQGSLKSRSFTGAQGPAEGDKEKQDMLVDQVSGSRSS